jgi:hypothetical protein
MLLALLFRTIESFLGAGDHPLQIVGENVKAHLRSDLFKGAQVEVGRAHPRLDGSEWMFRGLAPDAHGLGRTV